MKKSINAFPCNLVGRIHRRAARRLAVGGAEAVDGALPPGFGERGGARQCGRPRFGDLPHGRAGGVIERADHPGDIAQRRVLAPPLRHRPRRLALEIDDVEIVLHREHLSQVIVAVVPALDRGDLVGRQLPDRLVQPLARVDHLIGEVARRLGQPVAARAPAARTCPRPIPATPAATRRCRRGDRLRRESRVVAAEFGQRAVHLAGAQPELPRQPQKEMIGVGQFGGLVGRRRAGSGLVQRVVEIAREIVERHRPAVALIAHEPEQHAQRHRLRRILAFEPGSDISIVPSSGGVFAKPARSTRNRPSRSPDAPPASSGDRS